MHRARAAPSWGQGPGYGQAKGWGVRGAQSKGRVRAAGPSAGVCRGETRVTARVSTGGEQAAHALLVLPWASSCLQETSWTVLQQPSMPRGALLPISPGSVEVATASQGTGDGGWCCSTSQASSGAAGRSSMHRKAWQACFPRTGDTQTAETCRLAPSTLPAVSPAHPRTQLPAEPPPVHSAFPRLLLLAGPSLHNPLEQQPLGEGPGSI